MGEESADGRTIVVGIDGGDWNLIQPLVDEGKLPTFRRLMDEGAWGTLKSLTVPISSAAWTTITTGVNPGKHGIFDFSMRRDDSYDTYPASSRDIRVRQVWDILGIHGKKVAVVNVPQTYPPKKVNGVLVSGFPCPEGSHTFTYPSSFIDELRNAIDDDLHFQPRVSPHEEVKFLDEMLRITNFVQSTMTYLLGNKDFDFLMGVFVGPDALGHTFFKYMDRDHPKHEKNERLSKGVLDMYERLDQSLCLMMNEMDENDRLVLVSDHGFASVYYGVALNKWLMEKGYLQLKRNLRTLLKRFLFSLGLTYENLFKAIRKLGLVKKAQERAYSEEKSIAQELLDALMIHWDDIDWQRTRAYSQGNFGQIFVNLKGRQPEGCVESSEYDGLVGEIAGDLAEFEHKGERVFDLIHRGRVIYRGNSVAKAPDVVCMHSGSRYVVSRFFEFGSRKTITVHPVWSGTHNRNGIFLAFDDGRNIRQVKGIAAKVQDVTPTLLHLFGLQIPDYMDGRVLAEILR